MNSAFFTFFLNESKISTHRTSWQDSMCWLVLQSDTSPKKCIKIHQVNFSLGCNRLSITDKPCGGHLKVEEWTSKTSLVSTMKSKIVMTISIHKGGVRFLFKALHYFYDFEWRWFLFLSRSINRSTILWNHSNRLSRMPTLWSLPAKLFLILPVGNRLAEMSM